jgi:magnesium chelatase family protein
MPDLKDIKGQETAKRALEVAAAGGHNLLMLLASNSGRSSRLMLF